MTTITKARHAARRPEAASASVAAKLARSPSKLDQIEALLLTPTGTTIALIMTATGWQPHSVLGAMAGALKKRGLNITSDKVGGVRRYRASMPAS